MGIHEIEYMIIQKNKETIQAKKEVEAPDHIQAAWKLQQEIKNELDPYGIKGVNVIMNLNEK